MQETQTHGSLFASDTDAIWLLTGVKFIIAGSITNNKVINKMQQSEAVPIRIMTTSIKFWFP